MCAGPPGQDLKGERLALGVQYGVRALGSQLDRRDPVLLREISTALVDDDFMFMPSNFGYSI